MKVLFPDFLIALALHSVDPWLNILTRSVNQYSFEHWFGEVLENPVCLRPNEIAIAGQYWVDEWQAVRLLSQRADPGQQAGQTAELSP